MCVRRRVCRVCVHVPRTVHPIMHKTKRNELSDSLYARQQLHWISPPVHNTHINICIYNSIFKMRLVRYLPMFGSWPLPVWPPCSFIVSAMFPRGPVALESGTIPKANGMRFHYSD